jgi:Rrf2 family protein
MLKLTKKADYGLIAMKHLAECALDCAVATDVTGECCSAKDLADSYGLPQEALAKILQRLAKAGLLVSQYGTNGGYTLARDARTITAYQVIEAIEGPLFVTSCVSVRGECEQSTKCTVREPLRKVSAGIEEVLNRITIFDMATDPAKEEKAVELVNIEPALS